MNKIKIQTVLTGKVAEKFAESMKRNHRSIAGEAAFRIERSLEIDVSAEDNAKEA